MRGIRKIANGAGPGSFRASRHAAIRSRDQRLWSGGSGCRSDAAWSAAKRAISARLPMTPSTEIALQATTQTRPIPQATASASHHSRARQSTGRRLTAGERSIARQRNRRRRRVVSATPRTSDTRPTRPTSGTALAVLGSLRPPAAPPPEVPAARCDDADAPPAADAEGEPVAADDDAAAEDPAPADEPAAPAAPPPLRASVAFTCFSVSTRGALVVTIVALSWSPEWKSETCA